MLMSHLMNWSDKLSSTYWEKLKRNMTLLKTMMKITLDMMKLVKIQTKKNKQILLVAQLATELLVSF